MNDPRNDPRTKLWLIRHGETEWSETRRHTGRTDIPLTRRGEHQATELRRYLHGRRFTLVLCSPLKRAWETCRLAGYGPTATLTDRLLEWDYGKYEGRTTEDIRQERPGWSVWTGFVPQGESIEEVSGRANQIIQQALCIEGEVALFAHAHVLRILTACWLGLPPEAGRLFTLDPASVSVLGYERETHIISLLNHSSRFGYASSSLTSKT